jgi:hypothetical protein
MREWNLSHCAWSLGDKYETASMVLPSAASDGGWEAKDLTESGAYVRGIVRGWKK